jgi:hypothetical protein
MSESITWTVGATPPGMASNTVKRLSYPKDPADVTPVTGDFRGVLASIDSDSLSTTVIPSTLVLRNDGMSPDLFVLGTPALNSDATRVTVWIAGGTIGYEYLISITVNSVDDQILTRSFIVPVNLR